MTFDQNQSGVKDVSQSWKKEGKVRGRKTKSVRLNTKRPGMRQENFNEKLLRVFVGDRDTILLESRWRRVISIPRPEERETHFSSSRRRQKVINFHFVSRQVNAGSPSLSLSFSQQHQVMRWPYMENEGREAFKTFPSTATSWCLFQGRHEVTKRGEGASILSSLQHTLFSCDSYFTRGQSKGPVMLLFMTFSLASVPLVNLGCLWREKPC